MGFYLRSAGRVRSLFPAPLQRTALGGPECRRAAHQPGFGFRLEPGRAILQFRGLFGRQFTYGTLTLFRQNSLTLDAVFAYDPMGASYAFSPIGWQGITCGGGNTENCRHSTSLKYRVDIGQFRVAALWQFGGYELNNASTGAYQLQLGGDIPNLAGGTLSLDAIGSYVQNAVAVALAGSTFPAVLPQVLTATLSNNSSVMLVGK